MKLSIYIGLRAIAYVITQGSEIVKHGIKRVNISFDNYYEYIAGLPVSKRINRRMKRQARRNLWRYKSRKYNLRRLLEKEFNCSPQHLKRSDNLKLRIKALDTKLSNQEIVNVLCQLQNKRGYKSLRGVSDNDNSDYLKEIERHETNLKEYRSIAEYLLTLESSKNIIFTRKSYENEFNAIMDKQQIDEAVRNKIFNLIYFQNPLKKGKIGKCDYERNREVTHASNPLYQEFRIWRDVLNIKIYDADKTEIEIPFELQKKWFKKCHEGSNLTKASCCKDLGFKKSASFSWYSGKLIAANPLAVINKLSKFDNITTLWQELYSATDNDKLAQLIKRKYNFDDYIINELCDLDLNKLGYADFSTKAITKLLPHLQSGMKLKEAILHVYGKVDFENVALRNVVLEQHYFAYKALVERVRNQYQITEIQFELDPLLKAGNKQRKSMAQAKRKDEKLAKENSGLSSYNLLKLKLWNESGGISPYQPDYIIPLDELYTDKYNIDHIVPKSKIFERGLTNQVLCPKYLNEQKNRLTGFDFAKELGIEERYKEVVEKMPESKQQFLLMSENEIPGNWISKRQNSDYNTKCFATIGKATNIPNKLINRYTRQWLKEIYTEQDARHYLCKAWTMANMSQETINYFDSLQVASVGNTSLSLYDIKPSLSEIDMNDVVVFMPKVKFTRKTKYGYTPRFGLHQETVFGQRENKYRNAKGEIVTEYFYKVRQPISKLSPAMISKIMDEPMRQLIEKRIASCASHEDGIQSLIETPALYNGKPVRRVSVATNAEKIFALHSTDGKGNTAKKATHERKIDFVFSEKNRYLKVWNENGKLKKATISLLEYMTALNSKEKLEREFYLQENDIVKLKDKYWFVIGASESLGLRPVTTLSATDTYKVKADDWEHLRKVLVNQLGEVIAKRYIMEQGNKL